MLTCGDLFSGIGGFSLGLERAGMRTAWFAEVDPYASAVLNKHWPEVPNFGDIRTITADRLRAYDAERAGATVENAACSGRPQSRRDELQAGAVPALGNAGGSFPDVLCGGFPCQDISNAGKRAGIDGERSGLWGEYARIIGELRPRYVVVENVAALLGRGIERVLGDLAALGFDAEWHCIPASAVGAPHRRDRVWIIAYRQGDAPCAHAYCAGSHRAQIDQQRDAELRDEQECVAGSLGSYVADTRGGGGRRSDDQHARRRACSCDRSEDVADADCERGRLWATGREDAADAWESSRRSLAGAWESEPDVGRVAHGVPSRVDRLRCLGNAIVPQIAEIIGRAIVRAA